MAEMTRDRKFRHLEDENRALRILAEGCRRHPAYRARRRPGVHDCPVCDAMYDAARGARITFNLDVRQCALGRCAVASLNFQENFTPGRENAG